MWLLVSWAHCCSLVKSSLADSDHLQDWLKKLTLLIPETAVRHESCNGLYKLSLSGLDGGDSINRSFLLLAASTLLKFLPDAQALKPIRIDDYEEEPMLKPGCKEYFWLLCKLVDNIHIKDASQVCSENYTLTCMMLDGSCSCMFMTLYKPLFLRAFFIIL